MSSTLSDTPPGAVSPVPRPHAQRRARRVASFLTLPEVRWATAATGLFAVGGVLQLAGAPSATWWAAYLLCYAAGGWEPGLAGLQALRKKTLDVDLLMVVAAIVAAGIGQVFDGALLIVIFATSGALEAVATKRTADSVGALLELAPEQATRLGPGDLEDIVATAELVVGDTVLVRPGERIGADGRVVDGASEVDQASITGEPLPVLKFVGAEVFAGTVNGTGALRVEVTRAAHDSVVARIVAMVEQASATKAATQLFIEKIEQRYSVGMVTATVALLVVPLLFGATFQTTLLRAITFMIVASPCAVVLATMPPLLATIANAGRHGVLVKSAVVMEQLGQTTVVAFDKTGTLTVGSPRVTDVTALGDVVDAVDSATVLRLAAAAERDSEHPLAAAIVAAARDQDTARLPDATGFASTPGKGVRADVDGRTVQVGSPALLHRLRGGDGDELRRAREVVAGFEATGATAVVVVVDGRAAGVIGLADQLRHDAAATVDKVRELTGRSPALLTGDNARAADHLAEQVGISDVRAGLLPADKVDAVRQLEAGGARLMLVGDGVNDAPAMAAAHLGVAMGRHGSDLALQTADAVIVRDELATISAVISLSRRARRVVVANLVIAGAVIAALVTWDLVGTLPLPLGVAGHEGSTVVVGLNGLRLLRERGWTQAAGRNP